jgi:DnaJ family protein B protein 4
MVKDYYGILGINKSANDKDIKKAYRKLAVKWHPDKNQGDNEELAKQKFQDISEAYEVLSDKEKRKVYDTYGEEGVKNGIPSGFEGGMPSGFGGAGFGFPSGANGGTTFFTSSSGGGGGGMPGFHFNDPSSIFANFFGTSNPFEAENIFPAHVFESSGGGAGTTTSSTNRNKRSRPSAPIDHDLNCSLEDLYNGKLKKMAITKNITDRSGSRSAEKKVLEISVKPGWKQGTKITFGKEGDVEPGVVPADIIFTVKQKPHERFEREDDNLIMKVKCTLTEALSGSKNVLIETLDSRKFYAKIRNIISPDYVHKLKGEGMPKKKGGKGDLLITFDIVFPKRFDQSAVLFALKDAQY